MRDDTGETVVGLSSLSKLLLVLLTLCGVATNDDEPIVTVQIETSDVDLHRKRRPVLALEPAV
jgi:hypothetical protein